MKKTTIAALFAAACFTASPAFAAPKARVATALVLCMDTSSSIDADEYQLQYEGTARGFENPEIRARIVQGGLAVKIIEFHMMAGARTDWIVLRSNADIDQFTATLRGMTRENKGGTRIDSCESAALRSLTQLEQNVFASNQVIDVSGDGFIKGRELAYAVIREDAAARGIRINGLAILDPGKHMRAFMENAALVHHYETYVKCGGFVEKANGFEDYERAIAKKLKAEIAVILGVRYASNPRP